MILLSLSSQVVAQQLADFRIETDITEPGKARPIDQSVTLFSGGLAYEYSREAPQRVMVVDASNNRIIFVDSQRQIQTRVNLQELQAGIESAKNKLMQTTGGPEKIEDAAQTSFDSNSGILSVGKRFIRYDAKLMQPPGPEYAVQYANFANASASINAWQSRGSAPPPFARIQLNQAVIEQQAIPSEIKRTVYAASKETVVTSRIHSTFALNSEEQKKVEQFNAMILTYPTKTLAEFNSPAATVNR